MARVVGGGLCCSLSRLFWPLKRRLAEAGRISPAAGNRGGRDYEVQQRSGVLCPQLPLPGETGGTGLLITVVTDVILGLPLLCPNASNGPALEMGVRRAGAVKALI